jgi:hypothetical protein
MEGTDALFRSSWSCIFLSHILFMSVYICSESWWRYCPWIVCSQIYNIRTLSVNIQFIWTSFRNKQNSEPLASFSGLFHSEYKWILKSENLSDLNKKDRNKRHSSPFINVAKGVFLVVRVTLVPVSYLSAPSAVHSYRIQGEFIRRLKSLFVGWKVYSYSTKSLFV